MSGWGTSLGPSLQMVCLWVIWNVLEARQRLEEDFPHFLCLSQCTTASVLPSTVTCTCCYTYKIDPAFLEPRNKVYTGRKNRSEDRYMNNYVTKKLCQDNFEEFLWNTCLFLEFLSFTQQRFGPNIEQISIKIGCVLVKLLVLYPFYWFSNIRSSFL